MRTAAQYARARLLPEYVARNRERNAAWCAVHRNVTRRQPWLTGPPPFGLYLPGVICRMGIDPNGRWPLALRNVRHPHGAICQLVGEPHGRHPGLAIFPWGSEWWAYLVGRSEALAGTERAVSLFNADRVLRFGPAVHIKAPQLRRRGRQRVRVDAVTPVSTRSDGVYRTAPTAGHIVSSAAGVARRIGLAVPEEQLRTEMVEQATFPERVDVGGHWGVIRGWVGSVTVDVNAPMRWLLEVGARIGFGGRVSIGFGRIAVTEAT